MSGLSMSARDARGDSRCGVKQTSASTVAPPQLCLKKRYVMCPSCSAILCVLLERNGVVIGFENRNLVVSQKGVVCMKCGKKVEDPTICRMYLWALDLW